MFIERAVTWLIGRAARRRRARGGLGERGEAVAEAYLRRAGLHILARNWRCPRGEIDLVARERDVLVFVEVKTRRTDDRPEDAVDRRKRTRLRRAADAYLRRHPVGRDGVVGWRFDVVAVVLPEDGAPTVRHHVRAF